MRSGLLALLLASLSALSCGATPVAPSEVTIAAVAPSREAIAAMLDDWHAAAAEADETRYFGHLDEGAVFLGTDAKERWDPAAFRAYAHPHFARGKAWAFRSIRREITLDAGGRIAWFDEDLDAPNLGPSRGSGVVVLVGSVWKIRRYNLAITVPNERFDAVKQAAAGALPSSAPCASAAARVHGVVTFSGSVPAPRVPKKRREAEYCKLKAIPHNALVTHGGRLADVFVRIENGAVKGSFAVPTQPALIHGVDCNYLPRVQGARVGQSIAVTNEDQTLHNVHVFRGVETWFNRAQPRQSEPIVNEIEDPGIVKLISDVHPWMRGFVLVSDHPFFAVTGEDGSFQLEGFPPGKYQIEAWHSLYGWKRAAVEIGDKQSVELNFDYSGRELEPTENQGELTQLF